MHLRYLFSEIPWNTDKDVMLFNYLLINNIITSFASVAMKIKEIEYKITHMKSQSVNGYDELVRCFKPKNLN